MTIDSHHAGSCSRCILQWQQRCTRSPSLATAVFQFQRIWGVTDGADVQCLSAEPSCATASIAAAGSHCRTRLCK